MGVSINTRNVSFHERFIIREIMPSVLMNVLSSTLTFRHTVLPIKVVSLDNLDVISPTQKRNKMIFCPVHVLLVLSGSYYVYLDLSCPVGQVWPCPVLYLLQSLKHTVLFTQFEQSVLSSCRLNHWHILTERLFLVCFLLIYRSTSSKKVGGSYCLCSKDLFLQTVPKVRTELEKKGI